MKANVSESVAIGALVIVAVLATFRPQTPEHANLSLKEKTKRLDLLGATVLIPAVALQLIALQRGGTSHAWSNPAVWAYLLVSGILGIVFIYVQIRKGDRYVALPRILMFQKSEPILTIASLN